MLHLSA